MTQVLIVENDRYSVEVLSGLLNQMNIDAISVNSADEIDPNWLPNLDMIFLDLDLPGMDGFVIYNILRGDYNVHVPIIAYTVNTNERTTARKMGFNGMIAKPIDFDCFQDQMTRLLNGETVWDECN